MSTLPVHNCLLSKKTRMLLFLFSLPSHPSAVSYGPRAIVWHPDARQTAQTSSRWLFTTSSTRMQNQPIWVKNSKLRFCNHRVGLVETFPTMYNSAMRAPLAKPPQAPQVPSTGSLGEPFPALGERDRKLLLALTRNISTFLT